MDDPLEPIIKELQARQQLFVRQLDARGRNWFTGRIAKHVQNQTDVKSAATAMLTKAKTLAAARLTVRRRTLLDDLGRIKQNAIRARIVYRRAGELSGYLLGRNGPRSTARFHC